MKGHEYKYSFKNQFRTMASMSVYRTGHQQCSGGYHRGLEVRDFYLIHFVMEGGGVYTLNGKQHPVRKGQAFLIYPSMPIDYQADAVDPWEFCWVGFNGNDARLLMNATGFTPQNPVIALKDPERMEELLMNIYRCRGHHPHEFINMTAKLYELLAFLIQEASDPMPAQSRTGVEHVQRACDFIASHYQEPITINDIAGHVGICRSRLYRVFKAHLSISPLQYLTEFRLREACNLMNRQKATVKEVAYAAGFSDPLYFSTVFKKSLGQSPKEYMKSSKGDDTYVTKQ